MVKYGQLFGYHFGYYSIAIPLLFLFRCPKKSGNTNPALAMRINNLNFPLKKECLQNPLHPAGTIYGKRGINGMGLSELQSIGFEILRFNIL